MSIDDNTAVVEVIDTIKAAYHRDWDKQKFAFAREFLSRTWAGIPIPVLSVCGHGTQEIRHSTYLAYFLDGSKPHGVGTRYLNALLEVVGHDDIDTYESVVEAEKWIGDAPGKKRPVSCVCDIVVTCKASNHVIFIEQKVKSGQSQNPNSSRGQLENYDIAISGNAEFAGKAQVRVYLTPSGGDPTKTPKWQGLSYHALIDAGVGVLREGGLSGAARENLKRFLVDIALGPYDRAESEILSIVDAAEKATMNDRFLDRLRFDQLVSRNIDLVRLLMEG